MPDVPNCIALTMLLMLVVYPGYVADIGFIYSFVIVGFIVLSFAALPEGWRDKKETWVI